MVQIRDEKRELILASALKVFARRGVIGTKMSMIAAEAGISHGLLYHYFKSKDELFVTLVQQAMDGAADAMGQIGELEGPPLDKLRLLVKEILDEEGSPYFSLIYQARTSEGVPEAAKAIIANYSMDSYIEYLKPIVEAGQASGEIVQGDPGHLIACFLTVLSGLMTMTNGQDDEFRIPDIEMLIRMVRP